MTAKQDHAARKNEPMTELRLLRCPRWFDCSLEARIKQASRPLLDRLDHAWEVTLANIYEIRCEEIRALLAMPAKKPV